VVIAGWIKIEKAVQHSVFQPNPDLDAKSFALRACVFQDTMSAAP
jgi:hypothetical protein